MLFRCQDDASIWQDVYTNNEYQLPEDMTDWHVLDIGAHVGAFTRLCLDRGAYVSAFEPCLSAMNCLENNMGPHWGRLSRHRVAVTHEFGTAFLRHRIDVNTKLPIPAANSLYLMVGDGEVVQTVPLSFALVNRDWDLVKLDIEMSEYEAVGSLTPSMRRQSKRWVIESHQPGRHDELVAMFTTCGFTARVQDKGPYHPALRLCWFERQASE